VTEFGTVTAEGALLANVTTAPPAGAALESVTVQVVFEPAATVVLPHVSELTAAGATSDKFAVALTPFNVPVIVAASSVVKDPAMALKVALPDPALIETLAGMVTLPLLTRVTTAPAADGFVRLAVQTDVAPGPRDAGLHEIPLRTDVMIPVAVPPLDAIAIGLPESVEPSPPEIPMVAEFVPAARVTDTVAVMPLLIRLAFRPLA
jgi:hypothetical protein